MYACLPATCTLIRLCCQMPQSVQHSVLLLQNDRSSLDLVRKLASMGKTNPKALQQMYSLCDGTEESTASIPNLQDFKNPVSGAATYPFSHFAGFTMCKIQSICTNIKRHLLNVMQCQLTLPFGVHVALAVSQSMYKSRYLRLHLAYKEATDAADSPVQHTKVDMRRLTIIVRRNGFGSGKSGSCIKRGFQPCALVLFFLHGGTNGILCQSRCCIFIRNAAACVNVNS